MTWRLENEDYLMMEWEEFVVVVVMMEPDAERDSRE
jgi:hypothetical protein